MIRSGRWRGSGEGVDSLWPTFRRVTRMIVQATVNDATRQQLRALG